MLDARIRPFIDPPLNIAGRWLSRLGAAADHVSLASFALGMAAAAAIAFGHFTLGLIFIVLNRVGDGLDGAVARATAPTDRGAFLDIALDFAFYASIPCAFALADPSQNAFPAAVLLSCFLANGGAFLAFALMAEKRELKTAAQGIKSIYYVPGLAEGLETFLVFSACCLAPSAFPMIAFGFSAICAVSAGRRIREGWRTFA